MKLYYAKGACSLSVRIIMHEMGLTCDYEAVNLRTKKTEKGDDFLIVNSKGAVPVLVTDNNEILTENIAIHLYLADLNKATTLLPPIHDFQRYRVIEWLSYISSELHKNCGPLFHNTFPQDVQDNVIKPMLKNKLNFVEQRIKGHTFLLGDNFTLADAYLFVILTWLPHFEIAMTPWPELTRYVEHMKKRQSVQMALQEEGL